MEPTVTQDQTGQNEPTSGPPLDRPRIVSTPGTCGGKPRIEGHRITVKRLNSYAEPATKQVCDNFTRIDSDLDGNTGTTISARRCKGADGVWRDV